jgi:hypothetical protein
MDTGFLNRVGDRMRGFTAMVNSIPTRRSGPWLRRIQPFTFNQATHRRDSSAGDEFFTIEAVRLYFTRQGFVAARSGHRTRAFCRAAIQDQPVARAEQRAAVPLAECLRDMPARGSRPSTIPCLPFQGRSRTTYPRGSPSNRAVRLSESLDFQRVAFDRESTGERVCNTIQYPQLEDRLSVHQPFLSPRHRAVRRSPVAGADRFSVLVRSSGPARCSTPATAR